MLYDLQVELERIRHEVVAVMEEARPSLKGSAEMILATVWLGVIESRIRAIPDPEERRKLVNEFWKGRNAVERAIEVEKIRIAQGWNKETQPHEKGGTGEDDRQSHVHQR